MTSPAQVGELGIVLAEYRLSREFRRPLIARLVLLAMAAIVLLSAGYTGPGDPALRAMGWAMTAGAAATFGLYFWRGRFRTRLTSEGVEVRGYFRHFIPWRDITAVDVRGLGTPLPLASDVRPAHVGYLYGELESARPHRPAMAERAKLATVTVIRRGGRSTLLRAPLVTDWAPDHRFAEKAGEVSALWRWHTGQSGSSPRSAERRH